MKCIIMANGDYGDTRAYQALFKGADFILCADGGANYAYKMGVVPSYIVGDMDSIIPQVKEYFEQQKVQSKNFPRRKDFTDSQLILALAEDLGASEIIFMGSLGKRLDHTLSNLYSGAELAQKGIKIWHYTPDYSAYLVSREIIINGDVGDIVSVLTLSDTAQGVYEEGFEYPLENALLEKWHPYAISNVLSEKTGTIRVQEGLLLVLHYRNSKEIL